MRRLPLLIAAFLILGGVTVAVIFWGLAPVLRDPLTSAQNEPLTCNGIRSGHPNFPNPLWEDNFSGASLDPTWTKLAGNQNCPECAEIETYLPSNVSLVDIGGGNRALRLRTIWDVATRTFESAAVQTSATNCTYGSCEGYEGNGRELAWKFSRMEICAKLPYGLGMFPAHWLLPEELPFDATLRPEMDVMEMINNYPVGDNDVYQTLHAGFGEPPVQFSRPGSLRIPPGPDWSAGYHLYAVNWYKGDGAGVPARIELCVDNACNAVTGVHADRWLTTGSGEKQSMAYLILNTAIGSGLWAPYPEGSGITSHLIDWVRVWGNNDSGTYTRIPPAITQHPANQTVTAGQNATFSVVATGTLPLAYQWERKDPGGSVFNPIPGATGNTYTTRNVALTDSGAQFRCVASNVAGRATSNAATLTVNPAPDTTPPAVSLTAPANNATVSGTITVSANATDNVGVLGVQFLRNGANLGAEDTAAPYSILWDTTTAANGAHTLTARARDAATNMTTSAPVAVTVNNAPPPPPPPPPPGLPSFLFGSPVAGQRVNLFQLLPIRVLLSIPQAVTITCTSFALDGRPLTHPRDADPFETDPSYPYPDCP